MTWVDLKEYLADLAHLPQDALHIYAALIVQVAGALLLRRSLASFLPWILVFLLLIVNELIDLLAPGRPIEEWQVTGGLRDLWNTMVLPTAILLLVRHATWLFVDDSSPSKPEVANSGRRSEP